MKAHISLSLKFLLLIILLPGCHKENGTDKTVIKGVIKTMESSKNESTDHIIILAINSRPEVFAGESDQNGSFEISVPKQESYVIFLFSSASGFIGSLKYNNEVKALKVEDKSINLGNLNVIKGAAISEKEEELSSFFTAPTFDNPENVVFDATATSICSFLYNTMNEGDITVYQGCGDCDPYEIDSRLRLSKCSYEFDNELNMTVCAIQHYIIIPGMIADQATAYPFDRVYWHLTKKGFVQYKIHRINGTQDEGAGEIPDFLNVGTVYTGNNVSITILPPFSHSIIPTLDSLPHDGFVIKIQEGSSGETRYNWIVKGVGEAMYTNDNSFLDDGRNIKMKVIYKISGNRFYGTKPDWLTDEFLMNLPQSFTQPETNPLTPFNKESYLPVIENTVWNYSDGTSVKVVDVNNTTGTFKIKNMSDDGIFEGIAGNDDFGHFVGISSYSSPYFLPVSYGTAYSPLIYENSRVFRGLRWQETGKSNGYKVISRIVFESIDSTIVTPGGQQYDDCLVIRTTYEYPEGWGTDMYPFKEVIHFVKKGIGFVQKITRYADNAENTIFLTSYSIP